MTGTLLRVPGTGDPVSAEACKASAGIFDGRMRYDLRLEFKRLDTVRAEKGYQGPVVQCRLKYTPISGHFTTSEMTNFLAKSDQLYLWYAPLGDTGYFLPYRVLITTSIGDLSMVLTSLKD